MPPIFRSEDEAAFWRAVYLQELQAHDGERAAFEADAAVKRLRLRTPTKD